MSNRPAQLQNLIAHLLNLEQVLAQDPTCRWVGHFSRCLSTAKWLASTGASQDQLNELSGSVISVFGGMGSFNDYAPVRSNEDGTFTTISGMEGLTDVSRLVYDSALALRTVEP